METAEGCRLVWLIGVDRARSSSIETNSWISMELGVEIVLTSRADVSGAQGQVLGVSDVAGVAASNDKRQAEKSGEDGRGWLGEWEGEGWGERRGGRKRRGKREKWISAIGEVITALPGDLPSVAAEISDADDAIRTFPPLTRFVNHSSFDSVIFQVPFVLWIKPWPIDWPRSNRSLLLSWFLLGWFLRYYPVVEGQWVWCDSRQTMFIPLVYNTSCLFTSPNVSNLESIALSSYDIFRCAVVILVTLALILGNSILALAVNSKYSAGILQFQVSISSQYVWVRCCSYCSYYSIAINLFVLSGFSCSITRSL